MMSMPVDVVIKTKSLEEMKEAMGKIKEIKEANPHEVFKIAIEVNLRSKGERMEKEHKKRTAPSRKQSITYTTLITGLPKRQGNDVLNEQMQIIKNMARSLIAKGNIF